MLTSEILKQNESLASLSDEQLTAIETLSQNDENAVIGSRFGEVYRTFDENIAKASGIARNGDEKTYVYLDRVLGELKAKGEDATKQIADLTRENKRLEKVIAEGTADTETKKTLSQVQKDLASVTSQYNALKADFDKQADAHKAELFGLQIENELNMARRGLKFKGGMPQAATDVIVGTAIKSIKGMHPEFVNDGNGGKTLVFHDKEGAILRNPENKLNPFTASELLHSELKKMGILDDGIKQEGTGTSPALKSDSPSVMDVSGAKNRIEATDIISKQLLQRGLIKGSSAFQEAFDEAWKANNIASLPMR